MGAVPEVGDRFGRYQIERQLGRGGMGVVHLALDTQLQRRVALKVVSGELAHDPGFLARFHSEAEILTRLDSPHIITIFEHGDISGVPYLAMQYVAGGDLGSLLRSRGALPPALAAEMCAQVATAMEDAHKAGVIHRDVKPANVLLRDPDASEPFAYLSDFGLAKSSSADGGNDGHTQLGNVAGSWAYLAPERTRGEPANRASDIYALGCLFHACLTGRAPYTGSDVEIAMAHVNEPVPQLAGGDALSAAINRVLMGALAKEPGARYASAEAMRRDLLGVAATAGSAPSLTADARQHQTPPGPAPVAGRDGSSRRRLPLIAAAVTAAVVVIAGGVWLVAGNDEGEPTDGETSAASGLDPIEDPIAGDWSNDGHGDLRLNRSYFGDNGSAELPQQLWTANADGTGLEGPTEDLGQMSTSYAGDVDGDGRLDVTEVVESEDERSVKVQVWPGADEGLGEPREQSVSSNNKITTEASYGLGDFNGDGMDDLLLPTQRQDDYMVLTVALSNGSGFESPVEFGWRGGRDNTSDRLGIGDFDGDGLDDLYSMATNKGSGLRFRVFRSNGSNFARTTTTRIEDGLYNLELSDFVAADVDGDGTDELVSAIHMNLADSTDYGHGLTVMKWVNDSFVTPQTWSVPVTALDGYAMPAIGVSDVDGDGLEDIVQVADQDPDDQVLDLMWSRSTGTEFEDPKLLASPDCLREECAEAATIVSSTR